MARGDGPYKVLERIGDNAYKLELPGDTKISATFNVGDLSPYLEDGPLEDLRANPSQPEEVDAGASVSILSTTKSAHFMTPIHFEPDLDSYFGFKIPKERSIIIWQPKGVEESL